MREIRAGENPFEANKASEFSNDQILSLWVDHGGNSGGLLGIIKPTLRTPMLLLGGKGSGKTHLMRFCSAPVQAARFGGKYQKAFREEGYVGIYVLAEGLNTGKFVETGEDQEIVNRVFNMYVENWLASVTLEILSSYYAEDDDTIMEAAVAKQIATLFDIDLGEINSLRDILSFMSNIRRSVDFSVNNAGGRGCLLDIEIPFSLGQLIYGISEICSRVDPRFSNTLFVLLLDEVENWTVDQQKLINSLVRYRRGNSTIKVGARLYGIKTYATLGSGEPIKRDQEYERVELDAVLRQDKRGYEKLVTQLVRKRLRAIGAAPPPHGDDLSSYFQSLDSRNYWADATQDLAPTGTPLRERAYLSKLQTDLIDTGRSSPDVAAKICDILSLPDHLFLEKASVFMFRKKWPKNAAEAMEIAQQISGEAQALKLGNRDNRTRLASIISHFGSDILAQLYRDFRKPVPYTGFKTLLDLSQGVPRNLLTNLKHIYRRAEFAGEKPFSGGLISMRSQADGVRDGARWFWEDAQPDSHGLEVRTAVEALATLFRTVRFSPAPSECDLCTFSVDAGSSTPNTRLVLQIAENWSYLIKISGGRKNKNSHKVDSKYQLAPMLAPKWEVSEHRRGSIELKSDLANAIFDLTRRDELVPLFRRRVQQMLATTVVIKKGTLL